MVPAHPLCEHTKAGVGRVWHFSSAKLSSVEQVFDSGSGTINHSPKDFSRMFIVDGPALTRSVMTVACYRPLRANASATAEDMKPFLWLSRDFNRQALETWRFDDKLRGRPAIFNPPVHHFKERDMIPVVIRMERRVVRTSREKG